MARFGEVHLPRKPSPVGRARPEAGAEGARATSRRGGSEPVRMWEAHRVRLSEAGR